MPVHNAARFLAEAIDSILQQSFTDFELLILDDGSTDESAAIIRAYTDPRIRFYQHEKNLGITPTLNRGIGLAATDIVARMDGDDIAYPQRLQKQYDYLLAHADCALVSCQARVVSEERQCLRQDAFKSEYYYYNLIFESWIYHPTIMFRKKAVEDIGGYTADYSEEFELFWQLSRKHKMHNLPEVLLDYRITHKSEQHIQKDNRHYLAQHQQVLRNLQHYAGKEILIPASYIECYRHNFEPLLKEGSVREIVSCLQLLDTLTARILETPNPNRQPLMIARAAHYKREFIKSNFIQKLPRLKAFYLIFKTRSWRPLLKIIKSRLKRVATV